jgi:hypothetical protein
MDTRNITREVRLKRWADVINERNASGKTIKLFCEEQNICAKTYYYWQRQLREAAVERMPLRLAEPARGIVPSGWAKADSGGDARNAKGRVLPIEIGGCRVMADADTDAELLAKVCRVLASLC